MRGGMHQILASKEVNILRQEILSQCTWSDTYSSLKHILKRTANQLPLLIAFSNDDDDHHHHHNSNLQTILFFDRNLSTKLLFTPLEQRADQPELFDVYPEHCTFAMTDGFKGLFEFICNGKRCTKIFTNLEQLLTFSSKLTCSIVFMSRDRAVGYFQDTNASHWSSKEYDQGAIFRAIRIHRSTTSSNNGQTIPNDYLECSDEDGYVIFIKIDQPGRYSLIAISDEQQSNQPELYLHSTQTPNIGQLIKTLKFNNNSKSSGNCIRLVRGPVPYNFVCQYFYFIRQHQHDVLVGLTREDLVVEWNLDSHAPCRYATNLNDILSSLYGTVIEQILESCIDQARVHYRDHFQYDMQLVSTRDWTAFFQYWKWIGSLRKKSSSEKKISYQSRHRFHLIASIQDLSDNDRTLISAYRTYRKSASNSNSIVDNKKSDQPKQRSFLAQMSKLISTPKDSPQSKRSPPSQHFLLFPGLALSPHGNKPFDDSIYDSNQIRPSQTNDNPPKKQTRRTKSMK